MTSGSTGINDIHSPVINSRSPILVLQLRVVRGNDRPVGPGHSIHRARRGDSVESSQTGYGDTDGQSDRAGQKPGDRRSGNFNSLVRATTLFSSKVLSGFTFFTNGRPPGSRTTSLAFNDNETHSTPASSSWHGYLGQRDCVWLARACRFRAGAKRACSRMRVVVTGPWPRYAP